MSRALHAPTSDQSAPAASTVEIWSGHTGEDAIRWKNQNEIELLSEAEKKRLAAFFFEKDRRQYLATHAGLRKILAHRLKEKPGDLIFSENSHGKPRMGESWEARHYHFNLSHSGGIVVIALAKKHEVGVDVEISRPMPDALELASRYFTQQEFQLLEEVTESNRGKYFFRLWTAKEACIKAWGQGLSISLNSFVLPSAWILDDESSPVFVESPSPQWPGVWVFRLSLKWACTASLAVIDGGGERDSHLQIIQHWLHSAGASIADDFPHESFSQIPQGRIRAE